MNNILFLTWASYHRRPELLAQNFNAKSVFISYGQSGNLLQFPFRYIMQTWKSWGVLVREHPDVIFVQNPPIFAVMVVAFYARCYGARYIIDSHTGAFLSSKWRWSAGLHRALSRGALITIVHNKSQEKIVQNWRCPYFVLSYTPGEYPVGEPYPFHGNFNVVMPCGLQVNEPLDILFEAARHLPDVSFFVTGDDKHINKHLLKNKPDNIHLTGYLPYGRYVGLLRGASAIMNLINSDHTMLMGAFEAVSLGVPLIVSDWPLLRDYFSLGTIYIANTVEGVCKGVQQMQDEHTSLQREILLMREQFYIEWQQKFTELQQILCEA